MARSEQEIVTHSISELRRFTRPSSSHEKPSTQGFDSLMAHLRGVAAQKTSVRAYGLWL